MKRVGLLGWPLDHTLSPIMQAAAFRALGLEVRYEAMPVRREALAAAVARLRADEFLGANVTVPHKEAVIPLLDDLAPRARSLGAVNTIVQRAGRLIGDNTDAEGLKADLAAHGVQVGGRPAVILGAGGGARAAAAVCAGAGAQVRIVARRREQAARLQVIAPVEIYAWTRADFRRAARGSVLVLNATPVGMTPDSAGTPWFDDVPFPSEAFVYDLVYSPRETLLVQQARAAGLRAATGLGMLVEQGALAFELWTGKTAPRHLMRDAISDC